MINIPNEVRNLLMEGSVRKNFRVHFPNGERADITNENIVSESVVLTESLCSQSQLKFGICESPMLEFETFGVEKIKGYTINAYLEIECDSTIMGAEYKEDIGWWVYSIPYGTFVIDSCKKQADMTHRKIVAYSLIAYRRFSLPQKFIDSIQGFYWYKEKTIKFSAEGIIKLLLPNYERNYTAKLPSVQIYDKYETYTKIIGDDTYTLEVNFGRYAIHYLIFDDNAESERVTYAKASYLDTYKSSVESIANELKQIGWEEALAIESNINYTSALNIQKDEHDGTSTHGNVYYVPDDKKQRTYYPIKLFDFDESEFIMPNFDFRFYKEDTSPTNLGYAWNSTTTCRGYEYFIATRPSPDTNYYLPVRMTLLKNGEIIADTGRHENIMLSDNDNDLANSPSASFLPVAFNKQKVTMTKEDKNLKITTVKMDLYQLNINSLLESDPMEIVKSLFELSGQILTFKRNNAAEPINLINSAHYNLNKSDYETIWYDDDYSKDIARVSCTFTSTETENDFFMAANKYTTMPDDFREYKLEKNLLIDCNTYTQEQMEVVLSNLLDSTDFDNYMPCELGSVGLPWVEVGDYLNVETDDGIIRVLVEQRTLSGIQNLRDEIICTDEETTEKKLSSAYNETSQILIIR